MILEDKRLQEGIDNNSSKCGTLHKTFKKVNDVIEANKIEIEEKSSRLYRKIEKGDKELADADLDIK
jgi:hypothetical protein